MTRAQPEPALSPFDKRLNRIAGKEIRELPPVETSYQRMGRTFRKSLRRALFYLFAMVAFFIWVTHSNRY